MKGDQQLFRAQKKIKDLEKWLQEPLPRSLTPTEYKHNLL